VTNWSQQAERRHHRGYREQHWHYRRDQRTEGDQQHEQRHRHRQPLGALGSLPATKSFTQVALIP
jgi:hypothetical protein